MPVLDDHVGEQRLTRKVILSKIPAFPPVVLRALDLLAGDGGEIAELVRVITSDATLSAQVLRLANSALFAFPVEIGTVQQAVTAMGLLRVQSLIVTVATTNYMKAAMRTEALASCWRHTLAAAIVSRGLARAAGLDAERAYTLGLLHDIGRLGLLVAYPDTYDRLVAGARRDAVSLLDLEKRRFGMDHCEAGCLLSAEWGLPQEVSVATGRHHDRTEGGPFGLLEAVHFACRMADSLECFVVEPLQPATYKDLIGELPPEIREPFAIVADDIRAAVESAIGEAPVAENRKVEAPVAAAREEAAGAAPEESGWTSLRYRLAAARDRLEVVLAVVLFAAVLLGLAMMARR